MRVDPWNIGQGERNQLRRRGVVAIKLSGVPYAELRIDDITLVRLEDRSHIEGLRPSSGCADPPRAIPRVAPDRGRHVHALDLGASRAPARCAIPCLGTTQADYVNSEVPCTRLLTGTECCEEHERLVGLAMIAALERLGVVETPGAGRIPRPISPRLVSHRGRRARSGARRGRATGVQCRSCCMRSSNPFRNSAHRCP